MGLAQAILHKPKVLILDEPTSGLDPTQVVHVRELIQRLAQDTTVLFSTHILSEVEHVCERAIVLLGGKIRKDAHLEDLRSSHSAIIGIAETEPGSRKPTVQNGKVGPSTIDGVQGALKEISGVQSLRSIEGRSGYLTYELSGGGNVDLCREAYRAAQQYGWELGELRPVVRDLEAVFRDLVRQHERGETGHTQESSDDEIPNNVHHLTPRDSDAGREVSPMNMVAAIAKKELKTYFLSPIALIFIATFLLSALFSFFWVEGFFSRNMADIRPLFEWLPVLLIFLVPALGMRLWSEEERMGTIELLRTFPLPTISMVLGKFASGLYLIAVALALTFPIPLTVEYLGNLDWGPVWGGLFGDASLGWCLPRRNPVRVSCHIESNCRLGVRKRGVRPLVPHRGRSRCATVWQHGRRNPAQCGRW